MSCNYFVNKKGHYCHGKIFGLRKITNSQKEMKMPEPEPGYVGSEKYCYKHRIFDLNWPLCKGCNNGNALAASNSFEQKETYNLCHICIASNRKHKTNFDVDYEPKPKRCKTEALDFLNNAQDVFTNDRIGNPDIMILEKIYELPSIKEKNDFLNKKKEEMELALKEFELEVSKEKLELEKREKIESEKNILINRIKDITDINRINQCINIFNKVNLLDSEEN